MATTTPEDSASDLSPNILLRRHRANFFELPRELRDSIYKLVLVQRTPIELAPNPISDVIHRPSTDHEDYASLSGDLWHLERYEMEIRPALELLRVSKRMNDEACPVYYGQ